MDDEVQRRVSRGRCAGELVAPSAPARLPGAEFVDVAGTRIIGFELARGDGAGLGFPPVVRYYQPELEAFLREPAVAPACSSSSVKR